MAQTTGNGEQQTIGGGQRRCQRTSGGQTGDNVRQTANFGSSQYDDVAVEREFVELQDAVLVDVFYTQQAAVHFAPVAYPSRQLVKGSANQVVKYLKFNQYRQCRRSEVQQGNEQQ